MITRRHVLKLSATAAAFGAFPSVLRAQPLPLAVADMSKITPSRLRAPSANTTKSNCVAASKFTAKSARAATG